MVKLSLNRAMLVSGIIVAAALTVTGCGNGQGKGGGTVRLNGGGATFVDPIMQEWKQAYHAAKGVEIDYQPKGSGNGIQQMTAKTIQFGCSDAPMKKGQLDAARKEGGEVIHIPLIMGAVVLAYQVPGLTKPLTFSGTVLADIYLGKIKKWNDPAIKSLNADATLPDLDIFPVFRSDSSGTTNIFKEYLAKNSAEFKEKVGVSTDPTWAKGVGGGENGNDGVAKRVKDSAGAIGYVEVRYAKKAGIAYGTVKNKAGKAIVGDAAGVTAAAATAMTKKQDAEPYSLHELTFSLTDADGDASYPISGISYCVMYQKQAGAKGKALVEFLRWATSEGQKFAGPLDYAALPDDLIKKIDERLKQVELAP